MRVVNLCSGSKGNCTYININGKNILVDAGKNLKYIKSSLDSINVSLSDADYIFITHNHSDHVSALKLILKNSKAKLCVPPELFDSLKDLEISDNLMLIEDENVIDGIFVKALKASHDAPDARNYIFSFNNEKVSILTDTGYIKQRHFKDIYNSNIIFMESNHDIEMLQNGNYPDYLKKRILGDSGHLSNRQAGFYLSKVIGPDTNSVLLIHLSGENNLEKLALDTVSEVLKDYEVNCKNLTCAKQNEISEVF